MVAAVFGYFVFYARVQMWIAPILTLVFTLLLETFLGQTAGYQWRVGTVQLGGYNGMTGIPSFQLGDLVFFGYPFYYYVLPWCVVCFLGCRMLVGSHHGKVMLAIREDALRTELLGYDIRARQLATFVLAAVLAGISGLLYVQWGNYITPIAGRPAAGVAAGDLGRRGRARQPARGGDLDLPLNWLNYSLSSAGNQYALVIIGALLVVVMLFFPRGIIVTLARELPRRGWRATMAAAWRGAEHGRGPILRHRGAGQAVRRRGRDRPGHARRAGGRAALHHRPERRRQVDPVLAAVRHLPAGRGPHPAQGAGRHRPARLPARAARAWA